MAGRPSGWRSRIGTRSATSCARPRTSTRRWPTAQPRLPWIGTPDELAVWATALGLRKEIDDLFKRSLDDTGRSASGWSPAWYVGGAGSVANFGSVIGSISTTSASSSGSGYGGGSSGGGGGASGGF